MIVFSRNGKTTVVTGRKAWVIGAAAVIAAWLVLAGIAFLMIGAAVTVGLFLLLAIPAVVLVSLVSGLFGRKVQWGFEIKR
jgi:hypothetical protein